VGQASVPMNFWQLRACTATHEAQIGLGALRAKSHRNATADRVETSRPSYMRGRRRSGGVVLLPRSEATARTDILEC